MTDKPTDEALENLFVEETGFDIDDFPAAIFDFARAVLAKWGQPAQAAEPVVVVVPCYTPSGKRVALYSAKQDLPIGTQLYTAPQPSPTPQAASSAVLKAIREANMQLVRTGDNAFMLVPYKVATAQQASAHVLNLVQDAFAEVAMAYPKAFALHKVGLADTAVRKALAATAQAAESVPAPVLDSLLNIVINHEARATPAEVRSMAAELATYRAARAPAESVTAVSDLPPLPDPDLRDVGTKPQDVKDFLKGYATEYARLALAARAPAESVPAPVLDSLLNIVINHEARATPAEVRSMAAELATYRAARAPAESVWRDAERLDFLIEQRAYVVSDPDTCPGYWLHFVHKETGKCWVQCDEHPTPRAAIDSAMAANGGNK